MATEVGSLNASLTLDLSNFRAGMSEAAAMAAELGLQLQSVFSGDMGLSRMTAEILEMVAQISNLAAAMKDFQASMAQVSGADMFAQMRTYTASLPSEIASITSALNAADLVAIQLGITMQEIAAAAMSASTASQGLAGAGTSTMNFAEPLTQLQQMTTAMAELIAMMERLNTVDASTGEIVGTGEGLPAMYNILTTVQQIGAELTAVAAAINECTIATTEWAAVVRQVSTMMGTIPQSMRQANAAAKSAGTAVKGAGKGAQGFAGQTGKAAKNLQTSKGYAVSLKGILGGIVISQVFYQILNVMEDIVKSAITFSETMQDASVAFKYLFQDATTSADAFLNALKDIALQSPLDTTDLASASRKLMAMGFSADATVPTLQILTDTAAVFSNSAADMSDQIDHITLALGQMLASGKVSAQELRQLYNAGLPIYDLLADGLGITKEMAKNIGDYNIDSAQAVFAVLTQLQKRYEGAAADMSQTFSGSMEVIKEALQQIISYSWSGLFNDLTAKVNVLAQYLRALVKITQAYGIGGLSQAIFPKSSWTTLRYLIGGLQQLGAALKQVGQIFLAAFGGGLQVLAQVGSYVLPIVGTLANVIMSLARAAIAASPAIKMLLSIIAALVIGSLVAKVVIFLGKAIWLLTGAKAAAKMIAGLVSTIAALGAVNKVAIIAVLAIAAAFLAVAAASAKARAAIAAFFGTLRGAAQSFGESLGLGFDPSDVAMPEFTMPDMSDYSAGLADLTDGMDNLTESTDKAGSSAKKNLQSFDEVYSIDTDSGSDAADNALSGISDMLSKLGNIDYSDIFDWTGDWAEDWGNLSAGLGDLGDLTDLTFGDLGTAVKDFWDALTGGDSDAGLKAIDAIALALILFGKLKWAGALKVAEGIVEIVSAIKRMTTEGVDFDGVMDVIHGLTDVAIGIGLFVGNIKIVGWGLAIQGLTEIIQELADNWDAIRQGDWSGVSAATLIIGGLKILGGLVLALATFSATKAAAKGVSTAATAVSETTTAAEGVNTSVGKLSPKLTSLAKNLALGLVIVAEVAAAALLIVGAIILMGKGLEQVGIAWQPVIDNGATIAIAVGLGVAMLAVIGVACALLGSVGTTLIVNIALGIAILAEISIATDLFLLEIWAIGELLQMVGEAWQPVIDNGDTIATAIGLGTALLVVIGGVCALLGVATTATGGALPLAIGLGTAILAEMSIATDLFLVEIWAIGELLQKVGEAWQPVLDNGDTIAAGIELGTGLLIAIGVVTAALGVATVASAGLLPVAIGLGTAILVELAAAFVLFTESIVAVANELSDNLAPAMANLNGKLPALESNMSDFVDYMIVLAGDIASYTDSMGSVTWDSLVSSFLKFFTGSPIADLADDIEDVGNDCATLSAKLATAVPEIQKAVDLLSDYDELMDQLSLLTQENGTVTLAEGMLTNLKEIGEALVTGLIEGIENKTPSAVKSVKDLASDIVDGLDEGLDTDVKKVHDWPTTFATQFTNNFKTAFGITSYATTMVPYGKDIMEGVQEGISSIMTTLPTWLTTNVFKPFDTWVKNNLNDKFLYDDGQYAMEGLEDGLLSKKEQLLLTAQSIANAIAMTIQSALDIHSPSGVTTAFGEYVDMGLIAGMQNEAKNVVKTAADLSQSMIDNLSSDEVATPSVDLSAATTSALTSLQDWSTTFVNTITNAFDQIITLFATLDAQLANSLANVDNLSSTLSASTGSIAAADRLGATAAVSTGTVEVQSTTVVLSEDSIIALSDMTASKMYEYLAPLFAELSPEDQQSVIAYIGTLIADDAGLKQLERKLYTIRQTESSRR